MNVYSIFGLVLLLILGSSCRTIPGTTANPALGVSDDKGSLERGFQTGKALLESGYNMEAAKQFAYLRDRAGYDEERDRAVIGLSMALQDSGNPAAALEALQPLPVLPATGLEARKCVLAGELYLHQQNFELARTWLARGLEVEQESQESYRAAGLFNLGKAMLGEDNFEEASISFEMAGEIFSHNGDHPSAEQCNGIVADIESALL